MSEPHTDVEGRALASAMFPREWAEAETMTGKRRGNRMASLRRRAKAKAITDPLRAAGHSCADCAFYQVKPFSLGGKGRYCDWHSDNSGYLLTKPDDICTDHKTTLSSSLKTVAEDDYVERCFICALPLKDGDRVLNDVCGETGHIACFGPEREGYVKDLDTEEPLGPNDPLPEGYIWESDRLAATEEGVS